MPGPGQAIGLLLGALGMGAGAGYLEQQVETQNKQEAAARESARTDLMTAIAEGQSDKISDPVWQKYIKTHLGADAIPFAQAGVKSEHARAAAALFSAKSREAVGQADIMEAIRGGITKPLAARAGGAIQGQPQTTPMPTPAPAPQAAPTAAPAAAFPAPAGARETGQPLAPVTMQPQERSTSTYSVVMDAMTKVHGELRQLDQQRAALSPDDPQMRQLDEQRQQLSAQLNAGNRLLDDTIRNAASSAAPLGSAPAGVEGAPSPPPPGAPAPATPFSPASTPTPSPAAPTMLHPTTGTPQYDQTISDVMRDVLGPRGTLTLGGIHIGATTDEEASRKIIAGGVAKGVPIAQMLYQAAAQGLPIDKETRELWGGKAFREAFDQRKGELQAQAMQQGRMIAPVELTQMAARHAADATGHVFIPEEMRGAVQVKRDDDLKFGDQMMLGMIQGGKRPMAVFDAATRAGIIYTPAERRERMQRWYDNTKAEILQKTGDPDAAIRVAYAYTNGEGMPPQDATRLNQTLIPLNEADLIAAAAMAGTPVKTLEGFYALPAGQQASIIAQSRGLQATQEGAKEQARLRAGLAPPTGGPTVSGKLSTAGPPTAAKGAVQPTLIGERERQQALGQQEAVMDKPLDSSTLKDLGMPTGTTLRDVVNKDIQPLSEAQRKDIANFATVDQIFVQVKRLSEKVNNYGPAQRLVMGPLRRGQLMAQSNADVVLLDSKRGLLGNIARGIAQERGVLNEGDINRAQALIPSVTDTREVAQRKLKELQEFIVEIKQRHAEARGQIKAQPGITAPGQPTPKAAPAPSISKEEQEIRRKYNVR